VLVAVCLALAGVGAAAGARAAAPESCTRFAATPERVFHGDDFEFVHSAASAMYCPNDVFVQITACVQLRAGDDWSDAGCVTSYRAYVSRYTPGGRGVGLSFDVPCVSGQLRTHVTGGEGLDPREWDSETATIACLGTPAPFPTPTTTPTSAPSATPTSAPSATPTSAPSASPTPEPSATPISAPGATPTATPTAAKQSATDAGEPAHSIAPPVLTPARDRRPPRVDLPRSRTVAAGARGLVRLRLGLADEDAAGTLRLRAAGSVAGARFVIRRGAPAVVRVALPRRARTSLERHGRLHAHAALTLVDAAGNASTETFPLTIV
jgi:hypothetical protein